jgi:hypothetical protein
MEVLSREGNCFPTHRRERRDGKSSRRPQCPYFVKKRTTMSKVQTTTMTFATIGFLTAYVQNVEDAQAVAGVLP